MSRTVQTMTISLMIMKEKDDPLNEYRTPTNETCLQSVIPDYPAILEENDQVSLGNENIQYCTR